MDPLYNGRFNDFKPKANCMETGFGTLDYVVVAIYLLGVTAFGVWFRKGHRTVKDYFLGDKNISWVVIGLSIVATETSTLTLIGVPAMAYKVEEHPGKGDLVRPEDGGNFTFLQVVLGYMVARILICVIFIPAYFKGDLLTAYSLLKNRFGVQTKNFAASLFLVMRALAEGVRVLAASIVLREVLAYSLKASAEQGFTLELWSILIVGVLTLIYTFEGGITAVIWTDLIQLVIYVGGSLLAAWQLYHLIPGGWETIVADGQVANKFQVFSFSWDLSLPHTFWAGLLGGTFLTMASHGTDQLLVQRILTCKSKRDGQKALLLSGGVVFLQFALFLAIGVLLYVYYKHTPLDVPLKSNDDIFPRFIVKRLPTGVSGLVIAAIFAAAMSNLSASLNSLASTSVLDFYQPFIEPKASDARLLRLSRWCTAAWGIVLMAIALLARNWGSVFTAGLTISSIVWGSMLGAFLLGVLTTRTHQRGIMAGMATSLITMLTVKLCAIYGSTLDQSVAFGKLVKQVGSLAWTWYVLLGTAICMSVGYAFSRMVPESKRDDLTGQ